MKNGTTITSLLLIPIWCLLQSSLFAQGVPAIEVQALTALYGSTDGANWTNNTDWLGVMPRSPIGMV